MKTHGGDWASDLRRVPVVLAAVVLCAAAAFYAYAVKPATTRLEAIEGTLASRVQGAPAQPSRPAAHSDLVAGQLAQFYAFFDGELTYVDWLARFYDLAERTGITAQRVEYRSVEPAGIPLVLHEVSIPVTADYARIRAFSENVLMNVPVASLDQITFRRPRADQPEVEADLRFTFYLAKP